MEVGRQLQLVPLLEKKSFFLFGPRATGRTTLIRQQLAETAASKVKAMVEMACTEIFGSTEELLISLARHLR